MKKTSNSAKKASASKKRPRPDELSAMEKLAAIDLEWEQKFERELRKEREREEERRRQETENIARLKELETAVHDATKKAYASFDADSFFGSGFLGSATLRIEKIGPYADAAASFVAQVPAVNAARRALFEMIKNTKWSNPILYYNAINALVPQFSNHIPLIGTLNNIQSTFWIELKDSAYSLLYNCKTVEQFLELRRSMDLLRDLKPKVTELLKEVRQLVDEVVEFRKINRG